MSKLPYRADPICGRCVVSRNVLCVAAGPQISAPEPHESGTTLDCKHQSAASDDRGALFTNASTLVRPGGGGGGGSLAVTADGILAPARKMAMGRDEGDAC